MDRPLYANYGELHDQVDNHHKYWAIVVQGDAITVRFGRCKAHTYEGMAERGSELLRTWLSGARVDVPRASWTRTDAVDEARHRAQEKVLKGYIMLPRLLEGIGAPPIFPHPKPAPRHAPVAPDQPAAQLPDRLKVWW